MARQKQAAVGVEYDPESGRLGEVEGKKDEGIERELKVVRVGPNPRMVICEYWELESRRTCVVDVRKNGKFVKGMVFRMREPIGELEYQKAWEYKGVMPRRRGRW